MNSLFWFAAELLTPTACLRVELEINEFIFQLDIFARKWMERDCMSSKPLAEDCSVV